MLSGAHLINVLEKGNMIDGVFLFFVVLYVFVCCESNRYDYACTGLLSIM
jgi:hypothetical protein